MEDEAKTHTEEAADLDQSSYTVKSRLSTRLEQYSKQRKRLTHNTPASTHKVLYRAGNVRG